MVPRKNFFITAFTRRIEIRVNSKFVKSLHPYVKLKMLSPTVKLTTVFNSLNYNLAKTSVTSCKITFKVTCLIIVPIITYSF